MARKLLTGTREMATPTPANLPILLGGGDQIKKKRRGRTDESKRG